MPLPLMGDRLAWTCPEDKTTVIGLDPEQAEVAVRAHFARRPHEHLTLAGFTVAGPAIEGWVPEPTSDLMHVHGWCGSCKARRASDAFLPTEEATLDRRAACPRCGACLEDGVLSEPHPPVTSDQWPKEAGG